MRRGAALLGLAALAACSRGQAPDEARGAEHVSCALGAATQFAEDCVVERASQDGRQVLVVRHPDGAFRRFVVEPGGKGVSLADGAQVPSVSAVANVLEVAVGQDRYRFPYTVKAAARKQDDDR